MARPDTARCHRWRAEARRPPVRLGLPSASTRSTFETFSTLPFTKPSRRYSFTTKDRFGSMVPQGLFVAGLSMHSRDINQFMRQPGWTPELINKIGRAHV